MLRGRFKMEYIYAAMLLHKANKEINEANVKKVLEAAGIVADDGRIKALTASLKGADIDKIIEEAKKASIAVQTVAPAQTDSKTPAKEEKKEEPKEEEAAAGLGALFG